MDDVRVRLSAEGEAQVVAAMRSVVANAQKSGASAAKGFAPFNEALSGAKQLLAGLAGAASVGAFIALSTRAASAADQVARLSKGLGFSVRELSAIANTARTSEVPIESLQKGLSNLNKQVNAAREGNEGAVQTFRDLGLSVADFKGKDAADRIELVARAFAKLKDGPDKSALAVELFSKQGVALLPVLDEVANVGLAGVAAEAARVGAVFDEDVAAAADAAGDTFQNLEASSQGLALRFVQGLTPAIETVVGALTEDLAKGQDSFVSFGRVVGQVMVFVVNIIDTAGTKVGQLAFLTVGLVKALGQALAHDFAGAAVTLTSTFDELSENERALEERLKGRLDQLEAREHATRTVRSRATDDAPERGPSAATQRLQAQREAAIRRLEDERDAFTAKLQEAEGRRHAAAITNIEREAAKLEEVLQKLQALGVPQGDVEARVSAFRQALLLAEGFKETSDAAGQAFAALTDERQAIEDKVSAGLLSQVEGQEQLLALERKRLPQLQRIAQALAAAAAATKDPEAIRAAQDFAAGVEQLGLHVQVAGDEIGKLKAVAVDAFNNALKDLFTNPNRDVKTFIGLVGQLALAVVSAIQQVLAADLAAAATRAILKGLGLAEGGEVKAQGHADGGMIYGPGTATSDSIPAMLSAGEFVVRAAVVQQPGVLAALSALNSGSAAPVLNGPERRRRFADGGLVSGVGAAGPHTSLTVGLESGLVVSKLETPEGERAIVRILGKNRKSAAAALGRS